MIYHTWKAGDADDAPALCGALESDQVPDGKPPVFCPKCAEAMGAESSGDVEMSLPVVDLMEDGEIPEDVRAIALQVLGQLKTTT